MPNFSYGAITNPELAREADIQSKVVGHARRHGVMARKLDFGNGWPDYLFLYNGICAFAEFKRKGCKPTALQLHVHKLIREQGFHVEVIDNVKDGLAFINKLTS